MDLANILEGFSTYDLIEMEREAKDFAFIKGIIYQDKSLPKDTSSFNSVTLFPSNFPRKLYERAKQLQPLINELMFKMSFNYEFICESHESTAETDEVIKNLIFIYNTVLKEGLAQNISLGHFRSDYMINECNDGSINLKQVEMNNIPGFADKFPKVAKLHKHIVSKYTDIEDLDNRLPENKSKVMLTQGLIRAFELYNKPKAVILIVMHFALSDRPIEFSIAKSRPDIKIRRRSFEQMTGNLRLNGNRELILDERYEVAVVKYMAGYNPEHYSGEKDWEIRLMIERSRAIKCPSIQYQLLGTKKIQQIISNQTVLEKFINNEKNVKQLMDSFAGQWGLETDINGDNAIGMALNNPDHFVLKPQREGGSHNYFGNQLAIKLNAIKDSKERESYVLMETIISPKFTNYLLFANKSLSEDHFKPISTVPELGVFGLIIGDQECILNNMEAGHGIRTKPYDSNECGVNCGYGALDSPFLYSI